MRIERNNFSASARQHIRLLSPFTLCHCAAVADDDDEQSTDIFAFCISVNFNQFKKLSVSVRKKRRVKFNRQIERIGMGRGVNLAKCGLNQ